MSIKAALERLMAKANYWWDQDPPDVEQDAVSLLEYTKLKYNITEGNDAFGNSYRGWSVKIDSPYTKQQVFFTSGYKSTAEAICRCLWLVYG